MPGERRESDTRGVLACKKCHVRTQKEDGHLQAKGRGFRRNQTCPHLDLRLPASRTVRKYTFVEATQSVVFCYGSPNRLRQVSTRLTSTPPHPFFLQVSTLRPREMKLPKVIQLVS